MSHQEVIYQVELDIEAGIGEQFDLWLADHVQDMLAVAGFVSAEILAGEGSDVGGPDEDAATPPEAARIHRTVQYRVTDRAALEHYFNHDAERMRDEGRARFGDRFSATRRIFSSGRDAPAQTLVEEVKACRNCSQPLTGQYCHHCGQRDRSRMISLWELVRDLVGDLFDIDSRLWRSLAPLIRRPGLLTQEYLAGRRVHYTPPLRLYLVLSILFFVIATFGNDSQISFEGTDNPAADTQSAEAQAESVERCDDIKINTGMAILDSPEVLARVTRACQKFAADQGKTFARSLSEILPKMMFLFLPLLALVQKILYLGSRRFYVEHLLFFVHFHSFSFLVVTVAILLSRIPALLPYQGWLIGPAIFVIYVYIPVYLFKAMRRVYRQSFFVTLIKYCLLFVAYISSLAMTMLLGVLITALTV